MSDKPYTLWCHIEGDNADFYVTVSSTISVGTLRRMIKEERRELLQGFDAASLTLIKVRYSNT